MGTVENRGKGYNEVSPYSFKIEKMECGETVSVEGEVWVMSYKDHNSGVSSSLLPVVLGKLERDGESLLLQSA